MRLYWAVFIAAPATIILYLTDLHPLLKWTAYIILAILITAMLARILMPLILVAMHIPTPDHRRELSRRMWSESKYMLATLGVQSALSFISIAVHAANPSNQLLGLSLFILDTYLTARLVAECHAYMKHDTMMALSAMLLGLSIYLLYSLTLLGGLD